MVGTARMKKKGWIRETWPRENCRDPVAHLNQKGASGERGWAGWRTRLPAPPPQAVLCLLQSPNLSQFFSQSHSSLTLCLLSASRMSKGKGSGRPSGPGPVFRDQGGRRPPGKEAPFWGSHVSTRGPREWGSPSRKASNTRLHWDHFLQ